MDTVFAQNSSKMTSSAPSGGASGASGRSALRTVGDPDRPVGGGLSACVSTSNRYSLLESDHGDHQNVCEDRTGGASGASRTALTLPTMKVSQLEMQITEDEEDSNKNVKAEEGAQNSDKEKMVRDRGP